MMGNGETPGPKKNTWGGKRPGAGPPGHAHTMTHGIRTLERLLKEGMDHEHPIGALLVKQKALYISDIGGEERASNMKKSLCDRLARLDLLEALIDARLIHPSGRTRQLSWDRLTAMGMLRVKLTDAFARVAGTLGVRRREIPVPSARALLLGEVPDDGAED